MIQKGGFKRFMSTVVKFKDNLDEFRNIITLYRDEEGKLFVGNTFSVKGMNHSRDWMSALHREPLPEEEGLILGWNRLDDNLPSMTLIPEETAGMGVEDFLYAHGAGNSWKSVDYNVVRTFADIADWCRRNPLKNGTAAAFAFPMQA
jgi:hypothetical protein